MKRIIAAIICLQLALFISAQNTADLTIVISGLKNTSGQILIALFNSPDNFPGGSQSALGSQKLIPGEDSTRACFLDLLPGVYAISFVHDENNNDEMDNNMGIPREKYGVSNNVRMGFGPPKFNEAKFQIMNDTIIYIRPSN